MGELLSKSVANDEAEKEDGERSILYAPSKSTLSDYDNENPKHKRSVNEQLVPMSPVNEHDVKKKLNIASTDALLNKKNRFQKPKDSRAGMSDKSIGSIDGSKNKTDIRSKNKTELGQIDHEIISGQHTFTFNNQMNLDLNE